MTIYDHGAENMSESVVKERILKRLEMIKTKFSNGNENEYKLSDH